MDYKSRSIRLGDDVWAALQAHPKSANQILRETLGLDNASPQTEVPAEASPEPEMVREALDDSGGVTRRTSQPFEVKGAKTILIEKIPDDSPEGQLRAELNAVGPPVASGRGKATTTTFKGPLLKPKDRKKE